MNTFNTKVKVKAELSLCRSWRHVLGGVTKSTSIHTEPQNYMERAVSFMIRPLYPRRKNPGYILNTTLGGLQCRARYNGGEINVTPEENIITIPRMSNLQPTH